MTSSEAAAMLPAFLEAAKIRNDKFKRAIMKDLDGKFKALPILTFSSLFLFALFLFFLPFSFLFSFFLVDIPLT